mmetsp:Transcript_70097/g.151057  ORF Transcript_70097/g.151057 Transcript_70097/m.151057 type:complete len:100 (-) Transcript_70097:521-820(-)
MGLDHTGTNTISWKDFIALLREKLNDRRQHMVDRCWNALDQSGSGVVTLEDLDRGFCSLENPDVVSGKKSPQKVLQEFLQSFETPEGNAGVITKESFQG